MRTALFPCVELSKISLDYITGSCKDFEATAPSEYRWAIGTFRNEVLSEARKKINKVAYRVVEEIYWLRRRDNVLVVRMIYQFPGADSYVIGQAGWVKNDFCIQRFEHKPQIHVVYSNDFTNWPRHLLAPLVLIRYTGTGL